MGINRPSLYAAFGQQGDFIPVRLLDHRDRQYPYLRSLKSQIRLGE